MNLEFLIESYTRSPRILEIADKIVLPGSKKISCTKLAGSFSSFLFSSLYRNPHLQAFNHIIVLEDAEEAAYFHNDVEQLINPVDLFYFPSSFKTNKNIREQSSSHVMLRTEALARWANPGNKKIIVTYPEALTEKVVSSSVINQHTISIKVNDRLNTELLMGKLIEYGFERSDFVYEPGQFAMRGGIFDIYSFGNEKPYRIELFGDEVDSIRIFDPETQLSERKLLQVNLIPKFDQPTEEQPRQDILSFIPSNTIVYSSNWGIMTDRYDDFYTSVDDERKDEFTSFEKFSQSIKSFNCLELSSNCSIDEPAFNFSFDVVEQPSFNRQFDLLIKNLKEHESSKRPIYIFSENPKQSERLY